MIVILLLIPVLCVSFSLFIVTLINYILVNELDMILCLTTIFACIITSFFIIKSLIKCNESMPLLANIDNHALLIHGYFSFIIMLIFGITLIINSICFKINIFNFSIGVMLIIAFVYITIEYIIKSTNVVLELTEIDKVNNHLECLYLSDDNNTYELYVNPNNTYKEEKKYLCKMNKGTKIIKKVIKEVIEID